MPVTNLPSQIIEDSAAGTKLFFDSYGEAPLEFNSTDVDATVDFFKKKGFDKEASLTISSIILRQAKIDGVEVFTLLDTLSGFESIQLSALISQILNNNRVPTSTLGYKTQAKETLVSRNIFP
jgi:hypothetical protein